MPEYNGIITTEGWYYFKSKQQEKWRRRHIGEWFRANFQVLTNKIKDPKTREQLGYYWALLLPEIASELRNQGYSVTTEICGLKREVPIPDNVVHEALTAACGLVGEDGRGLRVSEMGKYDAAKFIDHVLDVAAELGMDLFALESQYAKKLMIDDNKTEKEKK